MGGGARSALFGVAMSSKIRMRAAHGRALAANLKIPFLAFGSGSGIRIWIGLQRHTLDPDPDPKKKNTDPQH